MPRRRTGSAGCSNASSNWSSAWRPGGARGHPVRTRSAPAPHAARRARPRQRRDLNFVLDGYYGYNFNRPSDRVNLLRAYDVTSNSFSINQAALILERAPDPAAGQALRLPS